MGTSTIEQLASAYSDRVRRLQQAKDLEIEKIAREIDALRYKDGRPISNALKMELVSRIGKLFQTQPEHEQTDIRGTDNYRYLQLVSLLKGLTK